jgi:hypothetical protein
MRAFEASLAAPVARSVIVCVWQFATGGEEEPLWGAFTLGARLKMGADDEGIYIFTLLDPGYAAIFVTQHTRSPRRRVQG